MRIPSTAKRVVKGLLPMFTNYSEDAWTDLPIVEVLSAESAQGTSGSTDGAGGKPTTKASSKMPRVKQEGSAAIGVPLFAAFDAKHPGLRDAGDPLFSPNFDQSSCYCQVQGR